MAGPKCSVVHWILSLIRRNVQQNLESSQIFTAGLSRDKMVRNHTFFTLFFLFK